MRACEKKIGWKRRLSVFLCLLFVIPGVLGAIPQAKLEVQAASKWKLYFQSNNFEMTKNTKGFYVGDYVVAEYGRYPNNTSGYLSMKKGASYKSSNPGVASINKTSGLVKPKKTGTTQITVSYKGVSKTCTLKIVSNLGVKIPKGMKSLEKKANALVKAFGKGITKSNRYQAVSANNQYKMLYEEVQSKNDKTNKDTYFSEETGCVYKLHPDFAFQVCMPALMSAHVRSYTLDTYYVGARNPIGTGGGKFFKIKSASGKGRQVTANLEKKVSEDQIFGLKAVVSGKYFDTKIVKNNRAEFPLYIRDKETGHRYYAIATATKGSKKLSIKLQSGKLKKGGSYQIVGISFEGYDFDYPITDKWTKTGNTSFKAK